ncbi:MAG: TerB family tellurite resistance protein [Chitinophagaceae bacterium]
MKRAFMISVLGLVSLIGKPINTMAQSAEIQQLLLDWQKLGELKNILKDMYQGYEVISNGYETIKNISEGNFNLHQAFLDGLLAVSPAVQNYKRVADIITDQLQIVKEYKIAFKRFSQDGNFNPTEIEYISKVYRNLFNASVENLNELIMVITAGKLRMSDDERLTSIDKIFQDTQDKLSFLRYFNNSTTMLEVQRAKEKNDVTTMQGIYGLPANP